LDLAVKQQYIRIPCERFHFLAVFLGELEVRALKSRRTSSLNLPSVMHLPRRVGIQGLLCGVVCVHRKTLEDQPELVACVFGKRHAPISQ
jgi:hypothetical protein